MSYANRGMTFEKALNEINEKYINENIAIIHKKPTPIRQVGAVKFGAFQAVRYKASTTDYNGVFKGLYVDFEAKRTANKTSLPLSMIQDHQYNHLKSITKHGGVGFVLVSFAKLKKTYLLPFEMLEKYWENTDRGGRKSIPIGAFEIDAYEVNGHADYIEALEKYIKDLKY